MAQHSSRHSKTRWLNLWILFCLLPTFPRILSAESRPNILVILADDLGYSDLGCYGSQIDTPNLDRLAQHGLRFTQFYNAARCCPTRAALLTGKYPHEVGLRNNGASLSLDAPTLAEVLRDNGYATAMTGKWHLTHAGTLAGANVNSPEHLAVLNNQTRVKLFGDRATYPAARGFQQHYGVIWGIVNFFHPFALVDGFDPVYDLPKDYYLTDALNEKTVEYLREFAKDDKPFFLYLAHTAPHWPLHAKGEDRAKYRGRFDDGWEAMRKRRYAKQLAMGLIDAANHPLPSIDLGKRSSWSSLSAAQKKRDAAKMETHAAMIDCLDQGLGRVIQTLKDTGQYDNTMIVFMSDNGASPEEPTRPGYDRPSQTPDGRPIRYTGQFPPDELGQDDTWTGLGPALANACNTPFRYWKKESYHGGNFTPFLVHWPAQLELPKEARTGIRSTKSGMVTNQVAHVVDLFPTILDAAGIDSQPFVPRGQSLLSFLTGGAPEGHRKLFFEHSGGAAFRSHDWKIVRRNPRERWALFDLSSDRTETRDLAKKFPQRVMDMQREWDRWWKEMTGDTASRPQPDSSPRIANRGFRLTAEVIATRPTGVVMAQGGVEHGYALHFVNGQPAFDVRIGGKVYRLLGDQPEGPSIRLEAVLSAKSMTLWINGQKTSLEMPPGLIKVQPKDPLNIGRDEQTAAGDYDAPNPFRGQIKSAQVSLAK